MKLILGILSLLLLIGCNSTSPGTNTGNPSGPVNSSPVVNTYAWSLVEAVCDKIHHCFAQADIGTCRSRVFLNSSITSELGPRASLYPTQSDLAIAEASGQVMPNVENFNFCSDALTALNCADPLVAQAYSTATPVDFSVAYFVLRASPSCSQIY